MSMIENMICTINTLNFFSLNPSPDTHKRMVAADERAGETVETPDERTGEVEVRCELECETECLGGEGDNDKDAVCWLAKRLTLKQKKKNKKKIHHKYIILKITSTYIIVIYFMTSIAR
jgi:hypothetical protein